MWKHPVLYSSSSKVYQVLHDVLQRTEPTHKAGLGNGCVLTNSLLTALFMCLFVLHWPTEDTVHFILCTAALCSSMI